MTVSDFSPTNSSKAANYRPANRNYKFYEQKWLCDLDQCVAANLHHFDFSLRDLAFELNLSTSSLYRKVFKLTGLSPKEYIRNKRLEKAKRLLESNGSNSLDEVAREIGYRRKDYFLKLYEEKYGRLPAGF